MLAVLHFGMAIAVGWAMATAAWAACPKPSLPDFNASSYYAPAAGLSGAALKSALHDIVDAHVVQTYSCVWDVLKEADQDPANPNNVIDVYSRRSIPKADQDTGGNTPNAWNREHVWANSHGFPGSSYHAYTDAHHLFAADKSINADRANDDFAYGGVPNPECLACLEDNNLETWEAPNVVKGDIARAMFYMATRYAGSGDGGTPDLELVDRLTNTGEPYFGDLCDLVAWHLADPVSTAEQQRNDVIYSWQGNRNPFADHPEYVVSIWGASCGIAPPTAQSISFAAPANAPVGSAVNLTASASSGLPVSFTSLTTPVCAVTGNTVNLLAAGSCSLTAEQSGNATYAPATPVTQTFQVTVAEDAGDVPLPAWALLLLAAGLFGAMRRKLA